MAETIPGGYYLGANGEPHDANGKPLTAPEVIPVPAPVVAPEPEAQEAPVVADEKPEAEPVPAPVGKKGK